LARLSVIRLQGLPLPGAANSLPGA
jgi:hypothetical protein